MARTSSVRYPRLARDVLAARDAATRYADRASRAMREYEVILASRTRDAAAISGNPEYDLEKDVDTLMRIREQRIADKAARAAAETTAEDDGDDDDQDPWSE